MSILLYNIDFYIHFIKRLSWNHRISNQQYTHLSKNYIPIKLRFCYKLCRISLFYRGVLLDAFYIFSLKSNCFFHRNSWNCKWRKLLLTIASRSWLCLEEVLFRLQFFLTWWIGNLKPFVRCYFSHQTRTGNGQGVWQSIGPYVYIWQIVVLSFFLPANGSNVVLSVWVRGWICHFMKIRTM